jgi:hypothetical protein
MENVKQQRQVEEEGTLLPYRCGETWALLKVGRHK